jgi:hypothetical protein
MSTSTSAEVRSNVGVLADHVTPKLNAGPVLDPSTTLTSLRDAPTSFEVFTVWATPSSVTWPLATCVPLGLLVQPASSDASNHAPGRVMSMTKR